MWQWAEEGNVTSLPRPAPEQGPALATRPADRHWWSQIVDRGERLAIAAAARPYAAMIAILALNAALAVLFVLAGWLVGGALVLGSWALCSRLPAPTRAAV